MYQLHRWTRVGEHDNSHLRLAEPLQQRCLLQMEDFERNGSRLRDIMAEHGYAKLLSIGPDTYFCNFDAGGPQALIQVLEAAASGLIDDNLDRSMHEGGSAKPVRVRLADFTVEVSGPIAERYRRLRRRRQTGG